VDLNHRPLGYEGNSALHATPNRPARYNETKKSRLPRCSVLLRFAPRSRTESGQRTPSWHEKTARKQVSFLLEMSTAAELGSVEQKFFFWSNRGNPSAAARAVGESQKMEAPLGKRENL
jgi:hypothetical protein